MLFFVTLTILSQSNLNFHDHITYVYYKDLETARYCVDVVSKLKALCCCGKLTFNCSPNTYIPTKFRVILLQKIRKLVYWIHTAAQIHTELQSLKLIKFRYPSGLIECTKRYMHTFKYWYQLYPYNLDVICCAILLLEKNGETNTTWPINRVKSGHEI